MFGDNDSVVNASTQLHAKLHKHHNVFSFHCVREAIASGYVDFHFLLEDDNPADMLSINWGYQSVKEKLSDLFNMTGDM